MKSNGRGHVIGGAMTMSFSQSNPNFLNHLHVIGGRIFSFSRIWDPPLPPDTKGNYFLKLYSGDKIT